MIACPTCDELYDLPQLGDGEHAECERCGEVLTRFRSDAYDRLMAFSATALICLILACSFPFMSFSRAGLSSQMTLPQSVVALWLDGMPEFAILLAAFIIAIPGLFACGVFVLAHGLKHRADNAGLGELARWVFMMQRWSMGEVFFVGVIVSLVKIAHMATVVMGPAFWAYAAFAVFLTLTMTSLDAHQCWRRIDAMGRRVAV